MTEGNNIDPLSEKLDNILIYLEELDAKLAEIIEKQNEIQLTFGEGFGVERDYDS
jgi:hypothetical protein